LTPMDEMMDSDPPLADMILAMEKQEDPMLSTEIEMLMMIDEARSELESAAAVVPEKSFTRKAIGDALSRRASLNWEAALNTFNRNVAFRANRIFNPARIADFYTLLCNQCTAQNRWREAMSALAYVGVPPSKYALIDNQPLWTYDPARKSPDDIVYEPRSGLVVEFNTRSLTKHVAEVMLDMDLSVDAAASARPMDEAEQYGTRLGERVSPHEWLYKQLPNDWTVYVVRDMVLAIFRVALVSTLEWQRLRNDDQFVEFRILCVHEGNDRQLDRLLPSPRNIFNVAATEMNSDPEFDKDANFIYEAEQVAKQIFISKRS